MKLCLKTKYMLLSTTLDLHSVLSSRCRRKYFDANKVNQIQRKKSSVNTEQQQLKEIALINIGIE